jgi:hypothetical protein
LAVLKQPHKPAKVGKASGSGSGAPNTVIGSKEAKAVVLREVRAKMQEEIVKHKEEQAAKVERLAKELGLDPKEVKKKLWAATGLKLKRALSLWDAKVWQKRREMNDGG